MINHIKLTKGQKNEAYNRFIAEGEFTYRTNAPLHVQKRVFILDIKSLTNNALKHISR